MKKCLLRIYDFFASHRRGLWIGFSAVLLSLVGLAISLRFHEDIMDFLPVEDSDRESLTVYQTLQNASRIVLIVESEAHGGQAETMQMENAIDACAERLPDLVTEADLDAYLEHLQFVYSQVPYFLTDSTLGHLDSLFSTPAIRSALQRDKTILATPGTGFLSAVIQSDPLGLVPLGPGNSPFTSVDGYMMTADRRMAFAFYDSPYGSTETQRNAALVDSLNAVTDELAECFPDLKIRWIGAPVVSVGNARRIKTDTLLCIALSLVLIIALLAYAFPRRRERNGRIEAFEICLASILRRKQQAGIFLPHGIDVRPEVLDHVRPAAEPMRMPRVPARPPGRVVYHIHVNGVKAAIGELGDHSPHVALIHGGLAAHVGKPVLREAVEHIGTRRAVSQYHRSLLAAVLPGRVIAIPCHSVDVWLHEDPLPTASLDGGTELLF